MKPFFLNEVEILDEYYLAAQNSDITFLKKFDNDRVLAGFRRTSGIATEVEPYNGWEKSLIGGHSVGHYLSACAQAVLATGDEELRAKLNCIIVGLAECQEKLGTGFLFGAEIIDEKNVEKQFDIIEKKETGDTWVPWYNLHKLMAGLVDTYKHAGIELAIEVASQLGDWVYNRVSQWDEEMKNTVLSVEYGGMNECLYDLYLATGVDKYRKAAEAFDEVNLFEVVTTDAEDTLNGRHANTTIPKFLGAVKRYSVLKVRGELTEEDEKYIAYGEKFWERVVQGYAYITGGVSVMEHFRREKKLDGTRTQTNCESCCAHNMLKLSRELFMLTGKKKYADYYEKTLRNAIMGAVNPKTGAAAYFFPMATGYYKVFGKEEPEDNMFWCCTGSGMENYTKLSDSIYFKDEDTLFVNQYVASKVTWNDFGMTITQESNVNESAEAIFLIDLEAGSKRCKLAFRIPDWSENMTLLLNGKVAKTSIENGYIVVDRDWEGGDQVQVCYPMQVRAYGLPDHSAVHGFQYGPIVLAARLGKKKMGEETGAGVDLTAPLYKVVGDEEARITISYGDSDAEEPLSNEWIELENEGTCEEYLTHVTDKMVKGDGMSFHLKGVQGEFANSLEFVPYNTLNDERYGLYWYFCEKGEKKEKEFGGATWQKVDAIQPGYSQYEKDEIHQMQESDSVAGNVPNGGSTRCVNPGGFVTYQFVLDEEKEQHAILCRFAKEDSGKSIRIKLNEDIIIEKSFWYCGEDEFFTKQFAIPKELIEKNKIKIKHGGAEKYVLPITFTSGDGKVSARLVGGVYLMAR